MVIGDAYPSLATCPYEILKPQITINNSISIKFSGFTCCHLLAKFVCFQQIERMIFILFGNKTRDMINFDISEHGPSFVMANRLNQSTVNIMHANAIICQPNTLMTMVLYLEIVLRPEQSHDCKLIKKMIA